MKAWAVRIAFASVLAILPAEMAVSRILSEPYPALYQPSFGSSAQAGNVANVITPTVLVTYDDGTTRNFDHKGIMADAEVAEIAAFESAFGDETRAQDPRTLAWLAQKVERNDRTAISAVMTWTRTEFDLAGHKPATRETVRELVLDLDDR